MRRVFFLFATIALASSIFLSLTPAICAQEAKQDDPNEVFTVVLLPDTQFYSEKYPETFVSQTMWIRERAKADNIKFVVCLGDIVQNAPVEDEWRRADEAARILSSFDDRVRHSEVIVRDGAM